MNLTKMYVLVNTDHYMSPGKIAAQVAHAVARLERQYPDAVIVLRATGEQINNIQPILLAEGIGFIAYVDEGVNEVPPYTLTAMAVETVTSEYQQAIFKGFKLL